MHQSEQLLKHVLQVNSYTAPIHKAKGHLQTQPGGKVPALPSSHAHVFTWGRRGEGSHSLQTLPKTNRTEWRGKQGLEGGQIGGEIQMYPHRCRRSRLRLESGK